MRRLFVLSTRMSYSIDKNGDDIVVRQSSGGLVSSIKSFLERKDTHSSRFTGQIWMGSVDASKEDWSVVNDMGAFGAEFQIEPVFIDKEIYNLYYNGFANSTLWPLFHYFPSL